MVKSELTSIENVSTNAPLRETVDYLWQFLHEFFLYLFLSSTLRILYFYALKTRFDFEGQSYKQIDGVATSKPLVYLPYINSFYFTESNKTSIVR